MTVTANVNSRRWDENQLTPLNTNEALSQIENDTIEQGATAASLDDQGSSSQTSASGLVMEEDNQPPTEKTEPYLLLNTLNIKVGEVGEEKVEESSDEIQIDIPSTTITPITLQQLEFFADEVNQYIAIFSKNSTSSLQRTFSDIENAIVFFFYHLGNPLGQQPVRKTDTMLHFCVRVADFILIASKDFGTRHAQVIAHLKEYENLLEALTKISDNSKARGQFLSIFDNMNATQRKEFLIKPEKFTSPSLYQLAVNLQTVHQQYVKMQRGKRMLYQANLAIKWKTKSQNSESSITARSISFNAFSTELVPLFFDSLNRQITDATLQSSERLDRQYGEDSTGFMERITNTKQTLTLKQKPLYFFLFNVPQIHNDFSNLLTAKIRESLAIEIAQNNPITNYDQAVQKYLTTYYEIAQDIASLNEVSILRILKKSLKLIIATPASGEIMALILSLKSSDQVGHFIQSIGVDVADQIVCSFLASAGYKVLCKILFFSLELLKEDANKTDFFKTILLLINKRIFTVQFEKQRTTGNSLDFDSWGKPSKNDSQQEKMIEDTTLVPIEGFIGQIQLQFGLAMTLHSADLDKKATSNLEGLIEEIVTKRKLLTDEQQAVYFLFFNLLQISDQFDTLKGATVSESLSIDIAVTHSKIPPCATNYYRLAYTVALEEDKLVLNQLKQILTVLEDYNEDDLNTFIPTLSEFTKRLVVLGRFLAPIFEPERFLAPIFEMVDFAKNYPSYRKKLFSTMLSLIKKRKLYLTYKEQVNKGNYIVFADLL